LSLDSVLIELESNTEISSRAFLLSYIIAYSTLLLSFVSFLESTREQLELISTENSWRSFWLSKISAYFWLLFPELSLESVFDIFKSLRFGLRIFLLPETDFLKKPFIRSVTFLGFLFSVVNEICDVFLFNVIDEFDAWWEIDDCNGESSVNLWLIFW